MKIGVVVDGSAESQALRVLLERVSSQNLQIVKPVYADIQPFAPPAQIARSAMASIRVVKNRSVDRLLLLMDLESNDRCPGDVAKSISRVLSQAGHGDVVVIIKVRSFENWLISDPKNISRLNNFSLKRNQAAQVIPGRADQVSNPVDWLNRAKNPARARYHKAVDSRAICEVIDHAEMAKNSTSFSRVFSNIWGQSKNSPKI